MIFENRATTSLHRFDPGYIRGFQHPNSSYRRAPIKDADVRENDGARCRRARRRANSSEMTFGLCWLNAQRDAEVLLLFRPFTALRADGVLHVTSSWGWTWERGMGAQRCAEKRQERAEQGEEGRANWMSEAQSCGLHLSFGSARNASSTRPYVLRRTSLSSALSPFFPRLSPPRSRSPPAPSPLPTPLPCTLTRNLSLNSAVASGPASDVSSDITRILQVPSNLSGIWSTYPGDRAKNPTTAADPPSCRAAQPLMRDL